MSRSENDKPGQLSGTDHQPTGPAASNEKEPDVDRFASRLLQGLESALAAPTGRKLTDYLADAESGPVFAGARFDTYAPSDPGRIEPSDVVALSFLSITIGIGSTLTPSTILELDANSELTTELLKSVPTGRPLESLSAEEFIEHLGPDSSATELYDLIRSLGVGPVTTHKLMARKRPELFPIRDSVVESIVGAEQSWWEPWWKALTAEPRIISVIDELRSAAGTRADHLSRLRVADIALWMSARPS